MPPLFFLFAVPPITNIDIGLDNLLLGDEKMIFKSKKYTHFLVPPKKKLSDVNKTSCDTSNEQKFELIAKSSDSLRPRSCTDIFFLETSTHFLFTCYNEKFGQTET